jgi:hypothetical protein
VAHVWKSRGDSGWNSPPVQIWVVVAIIQVKKDRLKAEARRRVSYQQQMDMSESFLNYGGNLLHTNMVVYRHAAPGRDILGTAVAGLSIYAPF